MSEIPETLHGEALRRIAEITQGLRQLENELRDAIVSARDVGTSVTRIAEVAGVSRDTVYRLLRRRPTLKTTARERGTAAPPGISTMTRH